MPPTNDQNITQQAINDPIAFYGTPEKVLADYRLKWDEKRKILISWEFDQKRIIASEGENMQAPPNVPGPLRSSEMLRSVQDALRRLSTIH